MFGIGFFEICIIALAVLIFIKPEKLPGFMQQLGEFFVQLRRMSNEVKDSFSTYTQEGNWQGTPRSPTAEKKPFNTIPYQKSHEEESPSKEKAADSAQPTLKKPQPL